MSFENMPKDILFEVASKYIPSEDAASLIQSSKDIRDSLQDSLRKIDASEKKYRKSAQIVLLTLWIKALLRKNRENPSLIFRRTFCLDHIKDDTRISIVFDDREAWFWRKARRFYTKKKEYDDDELPDLPDLSELSRRRSRTRKRSRRSRRKKKKRLDTRETRRQDIPLEELIPRVKEWTMAGYELRPASSCSGPLPTGNTSNERRLNATKRVLKRKIGDLKFQRVMDWDLGQALLKFMKEEPFVYGDALDFMHAINDEKTSYPDGSKEHAKINELLNLWRTYMDLAA